MQFRDEDRNVNKTLDYKYSFLAFELTARQLLPSLP
jgi:hypothetical protein